MNEEDKKLVNEYLAGNEAAFEKLLKKHLKPVFNFVFQFVKDKNAAEDVAQETFVKAWKNLHRFDRDKKFKTWLFAIAKNTAFDYLKKKKTIPFSVFADKDGNNPMEETRDQEIWPDEILERKNLAQELDKKLKQIPEKYRIILLMRYKEDFSLLEIAAILDKPYNTIKSCHGRAIFQLRKAFLESSASK